MKYKLTYATVFEPTVRPLFRRKVPKEIRTIESFDFISLPRLKGIGAITAIAAKALGKKCLRGGKVLFFKEINERGIYVPPKIVYMAKHVQICWTLQKRGRPRKCTN